MRIERHVMSNFFLTTTIIKQGIYSWSVFFSDWRVKEENKTTLSFILFIFLLKQILTLALHRLNPLIRKHDLLFFSNGSFPNNILLI